MGENLDKNQDKRLANLKPIPFTADNQPTPEAKSKGWEKRRAKQEIMDKITEIRDMSMGDLERLKEDIKTKPDEHTVLEAKLVQYLSREKFTIDFLDRNIGKAPQSIDVTSVSLADVLKAFDNDIQSKGEDYGQEPTS